MKTIKRVAFMACAMVMCLHMGAFAAELPETNQGRIGGSGVGYKEEIVSEELTEADAFISWHPDFSRYEKGINQYFFFTTKASMTISFGGEMLSITYNPASSGSGKAIPANPNVPTRPAIMGDVYTQTYQSGMNDFNTKRWVSVNTNTRTVIRDTYNKALEQ